MRQSGFEQWFLENQKDFYIDQYHEIAKAAWQAVIIKLEDAIEGLQYYETNCKCNPVGSGEAYCNGICFVREAFKEVRE